ncbi:NYN domain-containing protein, partial [Brevundimonas sp.]
MPATDRIALFIDGANLYSAARALNVDLDFRKLSDHFGRQGRLIRAYYYTAIVEGEEFSPVRPLVDWLDYNGFTVMTKPVRRFTDAQGNTRTKGNM